MAIENDSKKSISSGFSKILGGGRKQLPQNNSSIVKKRIQTPSTKYRVEVVKNASSEDIDDLHTYTGKVLTSPGNELQVSQQNRQHIAVLDNFTLLINETSRSKTDIYLKNVNDAIRRKFRGKQIKKVLYVKLNILNDLYLSDSNSSLLSAGNTDEQEAAFRTHWINLIKRASSLGASDIHIQTINKVTNIEFRINSSLREDTMQNAEWGRQLIQCLYYLTDSSESAYKATNFQQGRISNKQYLPRNVQSVRMQFNPSADPSSPIGGVYAVARLLYAGDRVKGDLDTLGYTAIQMRQLSIMRSKPYGINIIAGVTGSGKSTTLVKMLSGLKKEKPGCNIITIEDPPEYPISGVKQLPVVSEGNSMEARSAAFTKAITAVMRSDPDVIMIGEIRDNASANLAFEACQTGHQVYASLHASTATSILARLEDIGVENYKLADCDAVTGLIGQRLVPKLCPHCKISWLKAKEQELLPELGYKKDIRDGVETVCEGRLENVYIKNPRGCSGGGERPKPCDGGIIGRQVIAEIITPDEKFMEYIKNHEVMNAQKYWLNHLKGMTMREHSFQQVIKGEIAPMDAQIIGGRFDEFDNSRKDIIFSHEYMRTAKEWIEENS